MQFICMVLVGGVKYCASRSTVQPIGILDKIDAVQLDRKGVQMLHGGKLKDA